MSGTDSHTAQTFPGVHLASIHWVLGLISQGKERVDLAFIHPLFLHSLLQGELH